jgi:hypothetical protein
MSRILAVLLGCSLVAGLLTAPPAQGVPNFSAGSFRPVNSGNPVRVLDTRSGLGGRLGAVAPRHTVTAPVRTGTGDRSAPAVIKVTVPGNAPAGSLSVYPSGAAWNGHVTMSLVGGSTISQQLTVRLGTDGGVTIRNNSATAVHLIVEVLGYYQGGTPTEAGTFAALDSRILDTRAGNALLPGRRITLALPGRGGIPAGGASAVVLNIAVLSPRATGLLSVTTGDGRQATVHMRFLGNSTAPQPMQTQRVVKVNSDGKLTFSQSSTAGVHLVIDLMGYFLPPSAGSGEVVDGVYVPVSPRPIATWVGGRYDPQLRLYQHRPLSVYSRVPTFETLAYNVVISNDRPAQPALLGLYNAEVPWTPTVTLSSTPARQPTELTVYSGAEASATLVNLSSATWTYLHGYLTGYYWYYHCVAC